MLCFCLHEVLEDARLKWKKKIGHWLSVNNSEDKEDDVVDPNDFKLFLSFNYLFKNYLFARGRS